MRNILLILLLLSPSIANATIQVLRWPSNTPSQVCQPSDSNTNCGSGSGSGISSILGQDEGVGIGTFTTYNCVGAGVSCAVSNNTITATVSGAAVTLGGGLNAVQYQSPVGSFAGSESIFSMNGTNVGIGTVNGKLLFDVESSSATNKSMFVVAKSSADGATNVGIGTFAPNTRGLTMYQRVNQQLAFNMNSGGGDTSSVRFTGSNADSGNSLVFQVSSTAQAPLSGLPSGTSALYYTAADLLPFYIGTHSNSDFGILTADIPFAYFTLGQNVGIGTNAPGAKLSIVGNVGIGTVKDGDLFLTTLPPTGGILTEGNIGVGTWSNMNKLAVNGGVSVGATFAGLNVKSGEMAVTGNVGIGTFAPTKAFQVGAATAPSTTIASDGTFTLNGSGGPAAIMTSAGITQINGVAAGLSETTLTLNRGAGTTSIIQNTGQGNMRITGGADSGVNGAGIEFRATSGVGNGSEKFEFNRGTDGATKTMIILDNVGIGSVLPGTKLDVQGTIRGTTLQATGLTTGQCVQTTTGGVLSVTGSACGAGGSSQWITSVPFGIGTTGVGSNVGIGTTVPMFLLDVKDGNVGIGSTNTVSHARLEITNSSASEIMRLNDGGVNDTTPFIVLSSGGVGIGTTDITAAGGTVTKLNVTGNVGVSNTVQAQILYAYNPSNGTYFQANASVGGVCAGTVCSVSTGAAFNIDGGDLNSSLMVPQLIVSAITQTPTVSLSTAYQSQFLAGVINSGGGATVANNPATVFISGAQTGTLATSYNAALRVNSGNVIFGGTGTSNIGIGTIDPSNSLIIASGNVGISSLFPGTALDVQGTVRQTAFQLNQSPLAGGNVIVSNSLGVGTWMPPSTLGGITATATPGGSSPQLQYNNAGSMGGITATASDGTNVGIGTVYLGQFLSVKGNVGIGTSSVDAYITQAAVVRQMVIQTNVGIGTWEARNSLIVGNFASSAPGGGNIGIGTLAPGVALDINGTTRYSNSGDTYFGGNLGLGTTIPMGTLAVQGSIVQGTVAYTGQATDTNVVALSGNVGIGTWVPTQNLIIKGNVGIGTTIANTLIGSFAPASPGGQIYVQGNVGLGTLVPGSRLTIGSSTLMQKVSAANTACTTTCGQMGCYFGEDTGVIGTLLDCSDASADVCMCSK